MESKMKSYSIIIVSVVTALITSYLYNTIHYQNIPVEGEISKYEQSLYENKVTFPKSDYKLLTPSQVLSRYNAIDKIEVNIDNYQVNSQATINISKQCKHTGTNREKNIVTLYVDCKDGAKSLRIHDNGTLTNFSIEQQAQEESISITFNESYGIDFEKLNKHFTTINKTG
jgi:hypothetical protein